VGRGHRLRARSATGATTEQSCGRLID
jgi:hypothetical protein